jgi:membrane protein DedA with SNARE-associated domain
MDSYSGVDKFIIGLVTILGMIGSQVIAFNLNNDVMLLTGIMACALAVAIGIMYAKYKRPRLAKAYSNNKER